MEYLAIYTEHYGGPTRKLIFIKAANLDTAMKVAQSLENSNLKVAVVQPTSLRSNDFRRARKAFTGDTEEFYEY